jgi:hypothetical protein
MPPENQNPRSPRTTERELRRELERLQAMTVPATNVDWFNLEVAIGGEVLRFVEPAPDRQEGNLPQGSGRERKVKKKSYESHVRLKNGKYYLGDNGPYDTEMEALKANGYKQGSPVYDRWGLAPDEPGKRSANRGQIFTPKKEE